MLSIQSWGEGAETGLVKFEDTVIVTEHQLRGLRDSGRGWNLAGEQRLS